MPPVRRAARGAQLTRAQPARAPPRPTTRTGSAPPAPHPSAHRSIDPRPPGPGLAAAAGVGARCCHCPLDRRPAWTRCAGEAPAHRRYGRHRRQPRQVAELEAKLNEEAKTDAKTEAKTESRLSQVRIPVFTPKPTPVASTSSDNLPQEVENDIDSTSYNGFIQQFEDDDDDVEVDFADDEIFSSYVTMLKRKRY
jgi:hypothetical protein